MSDEKRIYVKIGNKFGIMPMADVHPNAWDNFTTMAKDLSIVYCYDEDKGRYITGFLFGINEFDKLFQIKAFEDIVNAFKQGARKPIQTAKDSWYKPEDVQQTEYTIYTKDLFKFKMFSGAYINKE